MNLLFLKKRLNTSEADKQTNIFFCYQNKGKKNNLKKTNEKRKNTNKNKKMNAPHRDNKVKSPCNFDLTHICRYGVVPKRFLHVTKRSVQITPYLSMDRAASISRGGHHKLGTRRGQTSWQWFHSHRHSIRSHFYRLVMSSNSLSLLHTRRR